MTSTLISAAQSLLTPELVSRVSTQTGESDVALTKGLGGVVPLLFASLAGHSDNRGLMSQVASLAAKTADQGGIFRSLEQGTVTSFPAVDPKTTEGEWVSSLLGGGTSSAVDAVARYAGIKGSSASSLIALAAPIVLGCLGRLMRADNLDANGLAERLRSDRQSLASAVPSGLEAFVPALTRSRSHTGRLDARQTAASEWRPSAAAWALPFVLGAALLASMFWWLGRERNAERIGTAGHVPTRAVGTAGSTTELFTRRLPGNLGVRVPRGGMEDRLVDYLGTPSVSALNREFDFDRIAFNAGSATLTEPSREQIANIAAILRAYPNTHVSIDGYTDNVGDQAANVDLSQARAATVMDALRDMGVAPDRMEAEGYGSRNPMADNSTQEGRARNRRVVLQVTSH